MKIYPNQALAIKKLVTEVMTKDAVLDRELKEVLKANKKWGGRDRRQVAQATYDIIRNYELIEKLSQPEEEIIDTYINLLHDDKWDLEYIKENHKELEDEDFISLPEKVWELYKKECPTYLENLSAMNTIGDIFIRVNTSLTSYKNFCDLLSDEKIEFTPIQEVKYDSSTIQVNAIKLAKNTKINEKFFNKHNALFEIQDIGSQILSEWVNFEEANTIIEACAGNGGKTTHILDKTQTSQPIIVVYDTKRKKLEHLQDRILKWKGNKVVAEVANEKNIEKYENFADILLMDMPCTGSGTIKRQADLKYRLSQKNLDQKIVLQQTIFDNFDLTLKSGGTLIYTTCSLFASENEKQIEYILSKGYELKKSSALLPAHYEGDGFFFAEFKKK